MLWVTRLIVGRKKQTLFCRIEKEKEGENEEEKRDG